MNEADRSDRQSQPAGAKRWGNRASAQTRLTKRGGNAKQGANMHEHADHDHSHDEGHPPRKSWLPRMTSRADEPHAHEHGHEGEWKEQLMASGFCLLFTFL